MFQDMHNFQQEVKAKQARFQSQAAQQRLVRECIVTGQNGVITAQPEKK